MKRSELKQIIREVIEESRIKPESGSNWLSIDGATIAESDEKMAELGLVRKKITGNIFAYKDPETNIQHAQWRLGTLIINPEYIDPIIFEESSSIEEGAMIDGIKTAGTTAKNAIRSMFNGLVPGAHFHLNWNGSINIFDPIYKVDKIDAERNVISYHNILTDKPSSFYLDEVIDEFKKSKTLPGFQKTAIFLTGDKLDEAIIIHDRLDVILRRGSEFKVNKGSYAILNSNSVYDVDTSVWEIVKKPGADRTIGLRARHNTEGYAHSVVTAGGFEVPLEEVEKYRLIAYYLKAEIEDTTVFYPISNIIEDAKIFHKENQ